MKYKTHGKKLFGIIVLSVCSFPASHLSTFSSRLHGFFTSKPNGSIGSRKIRFVLANIMLLIAFAFTAVDISAQKIIKVKRLSFRPNLDGSFKGWGAVPAVNIPLKSLLKKPAVSMISVKAGVYKKEVFFLFRWKDSTKDVLHKPYVWNSAKGAYVKGSQREDRLAVQFAMEGDYTTDWFSGKSFKADMWHWKAYRTNPNGLAHDKMTIVSTKPMKRAYKGKTKNGKTVYIRRPSDKGSKLYKTTRYAKKEKDVMPKYIIAKNATGSVTDIKAKGVWNNGEWTLLLNRKLNTGNSDDVVFHKGRAVAGGIAVFDHAGNDQHDYSDTLVFQF